MTQIQHVKTCIDLTCSGADRPAYIGDQAEPQNLIFSDSSERHVESVTYCFILWPHPRESGSVQYCSHTRIYSCLRLVLAWAHIYLRENVLAPNQSFFFVIVNKLAWWRQCRASSTSSRASGIIYSFAVFILWVFTHYFSVLLMSSQISLYSKNSVFKLAHSFNQ